MNQFHSLHHFVFVSLIGIALLIGNIASVKAQKNNRGLPFIKNLSSSSYKFHSRNFCVIQDNRGIMYFGNTHGILEYDGHTWNKIELPNGLSGISMAKSKEGKIFVGSAGEVGYLKADLLGGMKYESLLDKVPLPLRNFGEVNQILVRENEVVFCTRSEALVFSNNQFSSIKYLNSETEFGQAVKLFDKIYFNDSKSGLSELKGMLLVPLKNGDFYRDKYIFAGFSFAEDSLLFLTSQGIFFYNNENSILQNTPVNDFILKNKMTCALDLGNKSFALGTFDNGLLLVDPSGKVVQHINKKNGLSSNAINNMYVDVSGNLWLATDHGISMIEVNSPFTYFNGYENVYGLGYAAVFHKNKIYLGTSQGVYVNENNQKASSGFRLIPGSEGFVYTLQVLNDEVICGQGIGTLVIHNDKAVRISPVLYSGGWTYRLLKDRNFMIAGTYEGLELYEYKDAHWIFKNKIEGFNESSRILELDENENIWIVQGNKGLFRVQLNAAMDNVKEVKNYSELQHFAPTFFNDITLFHGKLLFASEEGVYAYDQRKDQLIKSEPFYLVSLGTMFLNKIIPLNDSLVCVIRYDEVKTLTLKQNGKYIMDESTFKKVKGKLIESYEYIRQFDSFNTLIGVEDGFMHYDPTYEAKNLPAFQALIRKAELIEKGDSLLFGGAYSDEYDKSSYLKKISYNFNSIRITFSAPFYEGEEFNQYQYYLEKIHSGSDSSWTSWNENSYKEYTNLKEGTYVFHVRAKNINSDISKEASYAFVIIPPWYRTNFAYIGYLFLIAVTIYFIIKFILRKIDVERERLRKEKEKEMILLEKKYQEEKLKVAHEIVQLRNQQLESEVTYKNNELAGLVTNLSQKTEFLYQLKKDLIVITKEVPDNSALNKLIKNIDGGADFDDNWSKFQLHFDEIHNNFLKRLREKYPTLNQSWLLFCAYLRMNKSNKEIASMMNISISAVDKRRYRLKEKLNLDTDNKLMDHLLHF